MSRIDPPYGLMPSLLDRLIDPESAGTAWKHGYGIEEMEQAVLRDVEDLLNTRQSHRGIPEDFTETQRSIVGYGLPDLTSLCAITPQQRDDIGRLIEAVVARFEPRLRDVRATLIDPGDDKERKIRFHINARLCVDPAPEMAFETVLELTSGHYTVHPSET